MSKIKPRGKVPKKASVDELIEIKTLIRHPMHSGRMKDKNGKNIPKRIINKFLVKFNGKQVFMNQQNLLIINGKNTIKI